MRRLLDALGSILDRTLGGFAVDAQRPFLSRWMLLTGFWLVQAVAVYLLVPVVYIDTGLPAIDQWQRAILEPGYALAMLVVLGGITILQALLVMPVRRPTLSRSPWPLWLSAASAGVCGVFLLAGVVMIMGDVVFLLDEYLATDLRASEDGIALPFTPLGLAILAGGWVLLTPLLISFLRQGPTHTLLSRLACRLFLGTVIEVVALIPLDIMVRRKTSCYCGQGTAWAIAVCIGVGTLVAGPAAWLPFVMRRRRAWYKTHCAVCAYDMSGCQGVPRCPECGGPWPTPDGLSPAGAAGPQ